MRKQINNIKKLSDILCEDHNMMYPLSQAQKDQIITTSLPEPVLVTVPKSQILERALFEKETVDKLTDNMISLLIKQNGVYDGTKVTYDSPCLIPGIAESGSKELWNFCMQCKDYLDQNAFFTTKYLSIFLQQIKAIQNDLTIQYLGRKKGEDGEAAVEDVLNIFEYLKCYNVLLPSMTQAKSETSEIDAYIITSKGVYVCEVKNKGNKRQTIHVSKDGKWEILNSHGVCVDDFDGGEKTPAYQNDIHCIETKRYLESKGFKDVPIFPLIIIANNKVKIENNSGYPILRKEAIYNYINSNTNRSVLSEDQQRQIAEIFDNVSVKERAFQLTTISEKADDIMRQWTEFVQFYNQEQAWYKYFNEQIKTYSESVIAQCNIQNERENRRFSFQALIVSIVLVVTLLFQAFGGSSRNLEVMNCPHLLIGIWTIICVKNPYSDVSLNRKYLLGVLLSIPISFLVVLLLGTFLIGGNPNLFDLIATAGAFFTSVSLYIGKRRT